MILDFLLILYAIQTIFINIKYMLRLRKSRPILLNSAKLPNISAVLPALNEEKHIEKCVDSILKQEYPGKIEINLVDNGSLDSTYKIMKSLARKNKNINALICKNKGRVHAITKGIGCTKHNIIWQADADYIYPSDWLKKMVPALSNPAISGVASPSVIHNAKSFKEKLFNLEHFAYYSVLSSIQNHGVLLGGNTLFKKKDFKEIGGYSGIENSILDDIFLGRKFAKNGKKTKYLHVFAETYKAENNVKQKLKWTRGIIGYIGTLPFLHKLLYGFMILFPFLSILSPPTFLKLWLLEMAMVPFMVYGLKKPSYLLLAPFVPALGLFNKGLLIYGFCQEHFLSLTKRI